LNNIIPSRNATKQYLEKSRTIMKLDADDKESLDSVERGK